MKKRRFMPSGSNHRVFFFAVARLKVSDPMAGVGIPPVSACAQALLYFVQSIDWGRFRFVNTSSLCIAPLLCAMILSLFALLHDRCASCRLSMSDGWPPLSTGMMWSIHGDIGCGNLSEKSTGFPHIPQTV